MSLLVPKSMQYRVPQQRITNPIASQTIIDWNDIDEQMEMLPDIMPEPLGFTLMILQPRPKSQTDKGILLPQQYLDLKQAATDTGIVLAMGPEAFSDKQKFPSGPWCRVFDIVGWDRYAGSTREYCGVNLLFMNDDQLRCRWLRPSPPANPKLALVSAADSRSAAPSEDAG